MRSIFKVSIFLLVELSSFASAEAPLDPWLGPLDANGALISPYIAPVKYTVISQGVFDRSAKQPEKGVVCIASKPLVYTGSVYEMDPDNWVWVGEQAPFYHAYPTPLYLRENWSWLLPHYKGVYYHIAKVVEDQIDYGKREDQYTHCYLVVLSPIRRPGFKLGKEAYWGDIKDLELKINVPTGYIPAQLDPKQLHGASFTISWFQKPTDFIGNTKISDICYYQIIQIDSIYLSRIIPIIYNNRALFAKRTYDGKVEQWIVEPK